MRNLFPLFIGASFAYCALADRAKYMSTELSSYDSEVVVSVAFGSGYARTTDSPSLLGEINNPIGLVWDVNEQFIYSTDHNGGGLIRKFIAVDPYYIEPERFGEGFNR